MKDAPSLARAEALLAQGRPGAAWLVLDRRLQTTGSLEPGEWYALARSLAALAGDSQTTRAEETVTRALHAAKRAVVGGIGGALGLLDSLRSLQRKPSSGWMSALRFRLAEYARGHTPPPQVLIVDDLERYPDQLGLLFVRSGWRAATFEDPRHALHWIEANASPALAIVDDVMPHANGTEIVRRIQELHPSCPCLMMQALLPPGEAYEAGAGAIAVKPFEDDHRGVLLHAVTALLETGVEEVEER